MINHFTARRLRVFVIAMAMALGVLLPLTVNAQSDSFFSSGEQNSRDGISLGGCSIENPGQGGFGFGNSQQENNLPLDSGLLIMVMAGVYVLLRRKHLKRLSILIISVVLMLELSQCKKDNVELIAAGEGVFITLDCGYNGGRTSFDPSTCSFVWSNPTEYINVGGSESGYLGQITGEGDGVSQTIRFSGTIATPVNGETLYFMYLGNGDHAGATVLDFSNQDGTLDGVTDYHVAVGSAVYSGQTSFTATLEMRVAFARIDMSDFLGETVYVHGDAVYATASIDYTKGAISGETKGYINVGAANNDKFVVLIPSTKLATTVLFDSDGISGYMRFLNGIQKSKFYANSDGSALSFMSDPQVETCKGLFSVDGTIVGTNTVIKKMVRFSPGNLQYNDNESVKWRFAEHQWDYVGKWNTNSWVDLFGWGTWGEGVNPLNTSIDNLDYQWNSDFKGTIDGYDSWYTLSKDEFIWLLGLYNSTPGISCREGDRYLNAIIAIGFQYYTGLIIFPDKYDGGIGNYTYNNYDDRAVVSNSDWTSMEAVGAVFLPAAGKRNGDGVIVGTVGDCGYYWSSTSSNENWANQLLFDDGFAYGVTPNSWANHFYGQSVRLVR